MENNLSKELALPELYFLIQKFLSASPMVKTFEVFCQEAAQLELLPRRLDWEGNRHERTFSELQQLYPHVKSDHLIQLCLNIQKFCESQQRNTKSRISILGHQINETLRNVDGCVKKNFRDYCVRRHGIPSYDNLQKVHSITNILRGIEISGPLDRRFVVNSSFYSKIQLQRETLGHLSAIYCLLFDHSGKYIITGADDLLVKIWSAVTGRLLATFRGAAAEISDIDINVENTLLAAGSLDKVLRVWSLQSSAPVAVLVGHTGMITSVNFCPSCHTETRYLVSTSTDGSVGIWTYRYISSSKVIFENKPIMYQEKIRPGVSSQMICSSFSPGGLFLATGSADHHVRIYYMEGDEGPYRLLEVSAHADRVDSIQWAHRGLKFLSGSKDGIANIWYFESQQWRNMQLLMSTKLPGEENTTDDSKKLKVTMVCWDCSDNWVITAVSDYTLKVWRAKTGKLEAVLKGHLDEIYVLEPHPKESNIVLSAGHDGYIFIWDVFRRVQIFCFTNTIEAQGCGSVFDAKWSYDGTQFAASDSHGHILIFGLGSGSSYFEILPKELFFHTDYRPLVRDSANAVLDEQTQVPPHLMPPPFLVDIEGNPYPPMLQKLVPGRENCNAEQLIPNIVVGTEGTQEIIEGLPDEHAATSRPQAANVPEFIGNNINYNVDFPNSRFLSRNSSLRRSGDIEGVRQSSGNWQRDPDTKWKKNVLVPEMRNSEIQERRSVVGIAAFEEMEEYRREMKRRPIMISTHPSMSLTKDKKKIKNKSSYNTRSTILIDANEEDPDIEESSSSSKEDFSKDDLSLASSDSDDTSGCSDWVEEKGKDTAEPLKRSKRKRPPPKSLGSPGDEENNDEEAKSQQSKTAKIPVHKEIPEIYKPLEWLAQTVPRKAPYCPQLGDEVVYFKQGHLLYISAVKSKKLYELNPKDLPGSRIDVKDEEFVKIVDIKYEIRPPRLCCLKLATLDEENRLTGKVFHVKYHDMADVLDFFVLKQLYDVAISRIWNPGDQFRCIIDDCWWVGEIVSKSPVSEYYPNSLFMCFEVRWFNGEFERMSPWDLEPICPERLPENLSEAVPLLPEELQMMLYKSLPEEWPLGDRDEACRHILTGLEKIMELAIAEDFLTPVDLNIYPTYAYTIEYPIDLSTIKSRFENQYYRRITAAQFDVRFLALNAEKFNEPTSIIVKHARILTELCLRVIRSSRDGVDVNSLYHQLMNTYESAQSDVEVDIVQPGSSKAQDAIVKNIHYTEDWKQQIKMLFDVLWKCEDSYPFRKPVDSRKHPDYYKVIQNPIDLTTIKEDLIADNYKSPLEFCDVVRTLLQNSRNYNTNTKSRIYSMTLRLSAIFEEHMQKIITTWKCAQQKNISKVNLRKRTNNVIYDSDSSGSSSHSIKQEVETSKHKSNNIHKTLNNTKLLNGGPSNELIVQNSKVTVKLPIESIRNNENVTSSTNSDPDSDYEPLSTLKQCNSKIKKVEMSEEIESASENNDSSDISGSDSTSDNEPLIQQVATRYKRSTRVQRRQSQESYVANRNNDSDTNSDEECILSVSSRGRLRKLTPRVQKLLKK